jgi:hypothetical protein
MCLMHSHCVWCGDRSTPNYVIAIWLRVYSTYIYIYIIITIHESQLWLRTPDQGTWVPWLARRTFGWNSRGSTACCAPAAEIGFSRVFHWDDQKPWERSKFWRETAMLQMCSQMHFVHPYLDLLLIHIHKHVIFGCGNSGSFAWFHACRLWSLNAACGMSWSLFPGTPSTMMTRRSLDDSGLFCGDLCDLSYCNSPLTPMGTRKNPRAQQKTGL